MIIEELKRREKELSYYYNRFNRKYFSTFEKLSREIRISPEKAHESFSSEVKKLTTDIVYRKLPVKIVERNISEFLDSLMMLYGPEIEILEENALERLTEVYEKLNFPERSILVVSGRTFTYEIAEKVCEMSSPYLVEEHKKPFPVEDATFKTVNKVRKEIRKGRVRHIVGVGGGTVSDVIKYSAKKEDIDYVLCPTIASHDGIYSNRSRIMNGKHPYSREATRARAIVGDLNILTQPKALYFARAGTGDINGKITADYDFRLERKVQKVSLNEKEEKASELNKEAVEMIQKNVDYLFTDTKKFILTEFKAFSNCGKSMFIVGSSQPASGSEHLFSHALDLLALRYKFEPALHGFQVGVGSIVCCYLQGGDFEAIKQFLIKVGAPTNAEELGIEDKWLIKALGNARNIRKRHTILHQKKVDEKIAEKALHATGILK